MNKSIFIPTDNNQLQKTILRKFKGQVICYVRNVYVEVNNNEKTRSIIDSTPFYRYLAYNEPR